MNIKATLFSVSIFLVLTAALALLITRNHTLSHLLLLQEINVEEASIRVVDHIHDLLLFR